VRGRDINQQVDITIRAFLTACGGTEYPDILRAMLCGRVYPRASAEGGDTVMTEKDDRLYLVHILECIDRLERYTVDGKQVYMDDL